MKFNIPNNIAAITPYPPGKPIDELEREYGITGSIKLASNENPWGPSPNVVRALCEELTNLNRYPDGSCYYLTRAIAEKVGVNPAEIVLGNGSNEVIEFLVKAFVREGDEVVTSHPSFLMYQKIVQIRGGVNRVVPLSGMKHDLGVVYDMISRKTRLVFLDNPNNPTGTIIEPTDLDEFLCKVPDSVIVVLDEAYVDYMDPASRVDTQTLVRRPDGCCPVVLLRTFSKAYGLPGLRVGYGIMTTEVATCLHKVRQPFNINRMAQAGALAALEDDDFYQQTLSNTKKGLSFLFDEVGKIGCAGYPSQANFFLIDVRGDADKLYRQMLCQGVIVRSMSSYGFPSFIRVTIGTKEENVRFLGALKDCLDTLGYV